MLRNNLTTGGGTLVAIKNKYDAIQFDLSPISSSIKYVDILGYKIINNFNSVYIIVLYIPSNSSLDVYDHVLEGLSVISCMYDKNVLVMEDFSAPLHNQSNEVTIIYNRGLNLIISDMKSNVDQSEIPLGKIDSHNPALGMNIQFNLKRYINFQSNPKNSKFFKFRKANVPIWNDNILNARWDILQYVDSNKACKVFYETVNELFKIAVPLK